jgi:hypothetical protein
VADQDDQEENRFSARAARYVKVGTNVGAVAARVASQRLFGLDADDSKNAAALAAALGGLKGPDHEGGPADGHHPRGAAPPNTPSSSRSCSRRPPRWGRRSCAGA